jgi:hypothetical protein
MSSKIKEIHKVGFTIVENKWSVKISGLSQDNRNNSWNFTNGPGTDFSVDRLPSQKEFLHNLLFNTMFTQDINHFDLNIEEFLMHCECIAEAEVEALLLLLKLEKL